MSCANTKVIINESVDYRDSKLYTNKKIKSLQRKILELDAKLEEFIKSSRPSEQTAEAIVNNYSTINIILTENSFDSEETQRLIRRITKSGPSSVVTVK